MEAKVLKILGTVIAVIVIALSGYGIISQNFEFMSYLMLLLGALMLVFGLIELQEDRKGIVGYMFIVVSLFIFLGSI